MKIEEQKKLKSFIQAHNDNNGDSYYESAKNMRLDSVVDIFKQYKK